MNDTIIQGIPEDYVEAVVYIIENYNNYVDYAGSNPDISLRDYHNEVIDFYALLEVYLSNKGYDFESLTLNDEMQENIKQIELYISTVQGTFEKTLTSNSIAQSRDKYNRLFGKSFVYEFTTGDLNRIQELLNELRTNISGSEFFTAEHKQRLLKRLEKIQSELHKKVSDMDRFWGLIGDAGVAIGKFGKDAKPIVDRVKEIADIVWRTQSKAEELPSGSNIPFLAQNTDE
ncbi:MAG: hypothetical protein JEY94_19095 [Melioribacteraceae bacterium]|nr:hypothetical protein [Melioribacteraceae bacterium]